MKKYNKANNLPFILKDSFITAMISLFIILPFVGIYSKLSLDGDLLLHFERLPFACLSLLMIFIGRFLYQMIRTEQFFFSFTALILLFISATFIAFFVTLPNLGTTLLIISYCLLGLLFLYCCWQYWQKKYESDPVIIKQKSLFFHKKNRKYLHHIAIFITFGLLVFFPFSDFSSRGMLSLITLLLTYIMLGWGLNIIVGLAGLLDLGFVAFFAVGAYSYALLAINFDLGFWTCLPLAGLFAAFAGFVLGFPVLRLRGDYFAIVTLGFGEIIRIILINWNDFTGGSNGLLGIPRPSFFGLELGRTTSDNEVSFHDYFDLPYHAVDKMIYLYLIILFLVFLTHYFTSRLRKMPIGRAWEAIREDGIAAQSMGINLRNTKLVAFTMSAMLGGFAGAFFATKQEFISPESFSFMESAIILAIVVLGGFGSQIGVVVATLILIGLPELIVQLEEYRMLAFGLGMVLIMILKPNGLFDKRTPTIQLHEYKAMRSE